jgi:glycosyltransferase involved in cell wall biosynthesis
MRILVISDCLPYPLNGGDRVRIYNLLRRVASVHEVWLAALVDAAQDARPGVAHLEEFCAQVRFASVQPKRRLARVPGLVRFALRGLPPELSLLHSDDLARAVRQMAGANAFDIVQVESRMGLYLAALPPQLHRKSVIMFQNFTFQQDRRVSQIERRWDRKARTFVNSLAMRYWEPRQAERFGLATTVSEIDRQLLLKANPRLRAEVIPNGVDVARYKPLLAPSGTPSLLFVGNMGYPPCADAMVYFCQEILPIIRRELCSVQVWIVGRNPRPEVMRLNGDGVHVTGAVDNVLPYYQQTAVSVVPLRAGGGTRLKILESMALGRPVISTTIGCEGLAVKDGEHLLLADDPADFAQKTIQLLTEVPLYQRLTANARKLVETCYDWDKIADRLMDVFAEL